MRQAYRIFRKMGGTDLLKQYWRCGVLGYAVRAFLVLGAGRKGLELLRLSVSNKVQAKLRKRYEGFIRRYVQQSGGRGEIVMEKDAVNQRKVWVCWLQGVEGAPPLVQRCVASLQKVMVGREIVVLREDNLHTYLSLPPHIEEKYRKGAFGRTHLSDLVRLELLYSSGGTWVDATVYCTGGEIPKYMLDSELFIYQNLKPGRDGHSINVSSWFMSSVPGHPVIGLVRGLLHEYWRTHDHLIDYFLIHHFFQLALEAYPDHWQKVIPVSNSAPHLLQFDLFNPFDTVRWRAICGMTPFHKLTYKFDAALLDRPGTFYQYLLSDHGRPACE